MDELAKELNKCNIGWHKEYVKLEQERDELREENERLKADVSYKDLYFETITENNALRKIVDNLPSEKNLREILFHYTAVGYRVEAVKAIHNRINRIKGE